MSSRLKPLIIGDLKIEIPIIQGGMGVKVSTAPLVSAVADCGAAGTIASVGLGYGNPENATNYVKASGEGLRDEIRKAKKLTSGIVGVNVMVALSNYEDLLRISVEEKADYIVSGAGLPLRLPEATKGSSIKLIPIVSSAKALSIIIKAWNRRYKRFPDAIVVEGPLAGGHLGFNFKDLTSQEGDNLEKLMIDVLEVVKGYEREFNIKMPVIAAGGIFYGKDVAKFLKLGASGVQIATRFVTTFECSVADEFKALYLAAKEEDVLIIASPVGMPGRVIMTELIRQVTAGTRIPVRCNYRCLKTCDPKTTPYCIAEALFNAASGNLDKAVVFAGSNVVKVNKIVSVKELIDEIVSETIKELDKT